MCKNICIEKLFVFKFVIINMQDSPLLDATESLQPTSSPCLQDLYSYFMETQFIPLYHFLKLPELSRNPINPSRQGSNKNWIWMERREVDGCVPAHTFSPFFLFGWERRCFMFACGARNLVIKIIVNMIIVNRN